MLFGKTEKEFQPTAATGSKTFEPSRLADWQRTGGRGAFVNLNGAGMNCDAHINEIPAKQQLKAERHLYEEIIFILSGQGATVIWNDGGPKHTLEWQEKLFHRP